MSSGNNALSLLAVLDWPLDDRPCRYTIFIIVMCLKYLLFVLRWQNYGVYEKSHFPYKNNLTIFLFTSTYTGLQSVLFYL